MYHESPGTQPKKEGYLAWKQDFTSVAVQNKNDICKRTQISPQGIYLHYGFNSFNKIHPHEIAFVTALINPTNDTCAWTPDFACYAITIAESMACLIGRATKHLSRDAPVDNPCFSAKIAREDRIAKTT